MKKPRVIAFKSSCATRANNSFQLRRQRLNHRGLFKEQILCLARFFLHIIELGGGTPRPGGNGLIGLTRPIREASRTNPVYIFPLPRSDPPVGLARYLTESWVIGPCRKPSSNCLSSATINCETAQALVRSGSTGLARAFCFSAEPVKGVPPPSGVGGAPICPKSGAG